MRRKSDKKWIKKIFLWIINIFTLSNIQHVCAWCWAFLSRPKRTWSGENAANLHIAESTIHIARECEMRLEKFKVLFKSIKKESLMPERRIATQKTQRVNCWTSNSIKVSFLVKLLSTRLSVLVVVCSFKKEKKELIWIKIKRKFNFLIISFYCLVGSTLWLEIVQKWNVVRESPSWTQLDFDVDFSLKSLSPHLDKCSTLKNN